MSSERQVPYAVMNYRTLVREDFFRVDHTRYLRELEKYQTPVFLRPKRFGKSLWVSLLEHYYDVQFKDEFEALFGKTDVGKNPTRLKNSFLVLSLDFSPIQLGTLAEIERNFTTKVYLSVHSFCVRNARVAVEGRSVDVDWACVEGASGAADMMERLRSVIRDNGLPPIYVIIDEYDNFTNELISAGRDADYDAICGRADGTGVSDSFFKAFFKSLKEGLKDGTVGRTYFTGVLPITLDDLSSGYNVGEVVNLQPKLVGMVGFTQDEFERYVDEMFDAYGFDPAKKPIVLADLKSFYDGYSFIPHPAGGPLYNSTICNWYLDQFVKNDGEIPIQVIDTNVRTDIKWFRRLAQTNENALAKIQGYIQRGATEIVSFSDLSAKFGRAKFFSKEFFPFALYYLGLLTFRDDETLAIPNLTIRNMFVDYYDELMAFDNYNEAMEHFVPACAALRKGQGSWREVFAVWWDYYVKARIPARAYDQMNENFFRTTFASRCMDALPRFYSVWSEFNVAAGRIDFLASPKPGTGLRACLIEFKYMSGKDADRTHLLERKAPDPADVRQTWNYLESLVRDPNWTHGREVEVVIVEVGGDRGYNWHTLQA